ncbi:MAG: hypothetical protein MJZ20_06660 [Bacteroidaceae bacterium]|nr:hypothetical protein [Bacteroidaceae bacterium]
MKNDKVLILGDCNSIFIKNYINDVLLPKYKVIVVAEGEHYDNYLKFYRDNDVDILPLWSGLTKWIKNLPVIRSVLAPLILSVNIRKQYGKVHMIHIHGLNHLRGRIFMFCKRGIDKSAITIWGQELLKKNSRQLKYLTRYYQEVDYIAVANMKMKNAFVAAYGDKFDSKLFVNDYALDMLPRIDYVKNNFSREELCDSFGMGTSETIFVCVGHNGRQEQRHLEICSSLSSLPVEIKKQITLLFTMTYGATGQYKDEVRKAAGKTGIKYVMVDKYMDEDSLAKYRVLCDVMIHAQITDAFSASIQECMYSGSIIINGDWLPYEDIENYHSRVLEYSEINQIPQVLRYAIENYQTLKDRFSKTKDVIRLLLSKEATVKIWKQNLHL